MEISKALYGSCVIADVDNDRAVASHAGPPLMNKGTNQFLSTFLSRGRALNQLININIIDENDIIWKVVT